MLVKYYKNRYYTNYLHHMEKIPVFNYTVKNKSNKAIDIYIDGAIVSADEQKWEKYFDEEILSESYKSFRNKIENTDSDTYNVYINSGGGSVTEAMAIHDLIKNLQSQGKQVNTIGRGIIASAATYILMASNNPTMTENSWLMIHNVSGIAWGDINDIEKYMVTLRKFNNQIRDFYANTTGKSADDISKLMNEETWMSAKDAKENNFIKSIAEAEKFENKINPENWLFKNADILNAYNSNVAGFGNIQQQFLKNLKKEIMDMFKNAFNANKPDENASLQDVINAVQKVFENADDKFQEMINKAVDEAFEKKSGEQEQDPNEERNEGDQEEGVQEEAKDEASEEVNELKNQLKEIKNILANMKGRQSTYNSGAKTTSFGSFE